MNTRVALYAMMAVSLVANISCTFRSVEATNLSARTIRVAQSGDAEVVGTDNVALQKAADMLRPGDTLAIGPGTWQMDNSLFVPSGVTVRGTPGKTILLKSRGVESALTEDGDYGESYLSVAQPEKFRAGMGITVLDDAQTSGWDISVSTVSAVKDYVLQISPYTVRDYNFEQKHARVRNTFPILCVMNAANVVLEDLIVDGNKNENQYIDGCRGGAIYLYNVRDVTVSKCVARNYNGDGISFQVTDKVRVLNSESYGHAGFGVHPGTGSANALVENCRMHHNGDIGLFLCWRVRHGRFANNIIEDNGHYGISIGHKDTDNEFTGNTIARNGVSGVYFRKETFLNSGHRNTFRNNKVLDNGDARAGYGFYIEPLASDIVIENNRIADTRAANGTQRYAVYKVKGGGPVRLANNKMEGNSAGTYYEGAK